MKVQKNIKFYQEKQLKRYTDLNIKFKTKTKYKFEKDFYRLINNVVFGKPMKNHRDIELLTNNKRKYQLVSETNDKATKWFTFNRNTKRKRYNEQTSLYSSTDSFILHMKKEIFSMAKNDVDKKGLIFLIKKSIDLFQLEKKKKTFWVQWRTSFAV